MLDGISGEEIYQRASTTRFQRGMFMHYRNYDALTTEQMEEMLLTTVSGANLTYETGQGNETPNYSNLPKYINDSAALKAGLLPGMPYLTLTGTLTHVAVPAP